MKRLYPCKIFIVAVSLCAKWRFKVNNVIGVGLTPPEEDVNAVELYAITHAVTLSIVAAKNKHD